MHSSSFFIRLKIITFNVFNLIAIIIYKFFKIDFDFNLINKIDIISFINVIIMRIIFVIVEIIDFLAENAILNMNILNFSLYLKR